MELLHDEYKAGAELFVHIGDISYANGQERVGANKPATLFEGFKLLQRVCTPASHAAAVVVDA